MDLLLGIDVGTSGAKALLVEAESGRVRAEATAEYPMLTPAPLWAEQNPADWWAAAVQSIRRVLAADGVSPEDVKGIGLTGQMHGLVLLDERGEVLRPCILWNDQRTGAQCQEITEKIGEATLLEWIGNPVLPGFTAPKILWVREHEPDVYARVAHILLPKDYVRFRLTGTLATDVSDASGTALLDVRQRAWSSQILSALDIPVKWLPPCLESPEVSEEVSARAGFETGLMVGTPVVVGAGDQAAGAVGAGIVRPGLLSAVLGTSGVVFAATDAFTVEPRGRLHTFCHAVPGQWHWMGVMLSAAGSLRWFRDALAVAEQAEAASSNRNVYDLLTAEAARVPVGSDGLLFLPYLTGERTPYPDPDARGVFFGLTLRHTKAHLIRAVLEGVAFGLRDSLELMRDMGLGVQQVRLSGGGAKSPLWRQIIADVFGAEIALVNVTEGAAYGAALLAGVGAGVYADVVQACDTAVRVVERIEPSANARIYSDYYAIYRALYPALAPLFKEVSLLPTRWSSRAERRTSG